MWHRKKAPAGAAAALIAIGLAVAACGSDDEPATTQEASGVEGLEEPGPAATEAAPEGSAEGPDVEQLSGSDEEAVRRVVGSYVAALNAHDAAAVCALFEPEGLPLEELPVERGDCVASLAASIGRRPPRGGPAWKRTRIEEVTAVSVGEQRARVTATVVHDFRDRKEPSIEEDVVYLDHEGERWLLVKPSPTFYRAVGYPEPPLRAFTPPEQ
jgi:hypothetical protein